MSSAPTYKELTKAIHGFGPTASLPLPDELVDIIDSYLNQHEKLDDNTSDKIHDELVSVFQRDIIQHPGRHAPYLALVRCFSPLLRRPTKANKWFDLLLPIVNHIGQDQDTAIECQRVVVDILTADDTGDANTPAAGAVMVLAERIMVMWFKESDLVGRVVDQSQDFREKHFKDILISYGRRRPKDFMTLLDQYICKEEHRASALLFFAQFVQSQPPHLYLILQTPLFGNLINCLQRDTSTTVVSLALTALTMILPHMPSSLVPHLPTLFNVYARLLFWERELHITSGSDSDKEQRLSPNALAWQKCSHSKDFDGTSIPHLLSYFTILYGLYPINFTDYIRKPQRYLRHADVPNADDVEVQPTEIRHASERFRQCHLLHENFYTLTIDSEKTDFGRWIKSEPAEVVADCVALCQSPDLQPGQDGLNLPKADGHEQDTSARVGEDNALLSSSTNFGTSLNTTLGDHLRQPGSFFGDSLPSSYVQSTMMRHPSQSSHHSNRDSSDTKHSGHGGDSPLLARSVVTSGSQTQLQDLINTNKAIKSGLHQTLTNDSVPSLALSYHESVPDRTSSHLQPNIPMKHSPTTSMDLTAQNTQLVGHLYLVYNDLTFERFMKQQHLTHMGELRRRHVREAATEAETQNLLLQNRQLRQRLEEAKRLELQAKTDSEKSRAIAKKWEADLTAKLRALREEQKRWSTEEAALQRELQATKSETRNLQLLVCESEVRELSSKQDMQSAEINVGELDRLRKEVARLTESERSYQAKEKECASALALAAEADGRAELLNIKLQAHQSDFQQAHDLYKSQIVVLNAKLQETLRTGSDRKIDGVRSQMESALAASRTQQVELKKRIADLQSKNTALEEVVLELQSTMPARTVSDIRPLLDPEGDASSDSSSPLARRVRKHRGFSDPEIFEGSYNPTPPLEPYSSTRPTSNQAGRPSTPSGTESTSALTKGSPQAERYFGRGGVQNLRKDKKDKKDDKERKKSTGLRGIRGFV